MCYDSDHNLLAIFGGCGFNGDSNDIYVIDLNKYK